MTVTRTITDVVDEWLDLLTDHDAGADELRALVDPEARFVEHPSSINPEGSQRDRHAMLGGLMVARGLLAWQRYDQREHDQLGPDRVATRARWQGQLLMDVGSLRRGQVVTAHVALFVTLRDGRIVHQENFDCYDRW